TGFLIAVVFASCVKNQPFLEAYSVPAEYIEENTTDSSALGRVIMMHAMNNYLATSVSASLDAAVTDSLWLNKGKPFTSAMAPDFVYADTMLNNMRSVNLASATGDADSLKLFADSVVYLSRFYNVSGAQGTAGAQSQVLPAPAKRLLNEQGAELNEIWFHAMLGALSMRDAFSNFAGSVNNAGLAWDLAYRYIGFPSS